MLEPTEPPRCPPPAPSAGLRDGILCEYRLISRHTMQPLCGSVLSRPCDRCGLLPTATEPPPRLAPRRHAICSAARRAFICRGLGLFWFVLFFESWRPESPKLSPKVQAVSPRGALTCLTLQRLPEEARQSQASMAAEMTRFEC